jgi:hypothetical protein
MVVGSSTVAFMSCSTSERVSLFAVPETVEAALDGKALNEPARESLVLNRFAQDFCVGGAVVEADASLPLLVAGSSEATLTSFASAFACVVSESFDWVETAESRCADRTAGGLVGRIGTAGITEATGRAFGCVGVFETEAGTTDEGVVGCVEAASDGASDGNGVEA